MQLCSLSMTNASPYHSSPVAMGHFHNLDISTALTHVTPFSLSAIFPVQTKLRFIRVRNTSPEVSNEKVCPLKLVTVQTRMRKTSMKMRFPEAACRSSSVLQTQCCSSWSQTMLEVKMLIC